MKKLVSLLLVAALGAACCLSMTACKKEEKIDLQPVVDEVRAMTHDELLEKAKNETGNFFAYGNTSRIKDAMNNFIETDDGKALGLTKSNAIGTKKDDAAIYMELGNEKKNPRGANNASMVLIQDSAQLKLQTAATDLLTNYVPKDMDDKVNADDKLPLAHQFINKLFIYNVADPEHTRQFTNVWQLTEAGYKDKIYFKSPASEQVNKNFLIMLTSDEWSAKLKTAYLKQYNNVESTEVGTGKDQYKNYGYLWVAKFLANCSFAINSDTTIAQDLSKPTNKDKMGLFVLSKFRDASVVTSNLKVSAWDETADSTPANQKFVTIEPFAGFMYSIYAQVATYGPRPYTAMLFINYLMTEAGFKPWASLGGYSSNKDIPVFDKSVQDAQLVEFDFDGNGTLSDEEKAYVLYKDNNGDYMLLTSKKTYTYVNVTVGGEENAKTYTVTGIVKDGANNKTIKEDAEITLEDGKKATLKADAVKSNTSTGVKDQPLSFWRNTLVIEDGDYINQAGPDVEDWVLAQAKKN